MQEYQQLALTEIKASADNPRATVKYANLSADMKARGLINPITVFRSNGGYEIIAGHRRYQAARHLQWKKIPCHIVDVKPEKNKEPADSVDVHLMRWSENLERTDLTTYEIGTSLMKIKRLGGYSQAELCKATGYKMSTVKKYGQLLGEPDRLAPVIEDAWKANHPLLTLTTLIDVIWCGGDKDAQLEAWKTLQEAERTGPAPKSAKGGTDDSDETDQDTDDTEPGKPKGRKAISPVKLKMITAMVETMTEEDGIRDDARPLVVAVLRFALGQTKDIRVGSHIVLADPVGRYDAIRKQAIEDQRKARAAQVKAAKEAAARKEASEKFRKDSEARYGDATGAANAAAKAAEIAAFARASATESATMKDAAASVDTAATAANDAEDAHKFAVMVVAELHEHSPDSDAAATADQAAQTAAIHAIAARDHARAAAEAAKAKA